MSIIPAIKSPRQTFLKFEPIPGYIGSSRPASATQWNLKKINKTKIKKSKVNIYSPMGLEVSGLSKCPEPLLPLH